MILTQEDNQQQKFPNFQDDCYFCSSLSETILISELKRKHSESFSKFHSSLTSSRQETWGDGQLLLFNVQWNCVGREYEVKFRREHNFTWALISSMHSQSHGSHAQESHPFWCALYMLLLWIEFCQWQQWTNSIYVQCSQRLLTLRAALVIEADPVLRQNLILFAAATNFLLWLESLSKICLLQFHGKACSLWFWVQWSVFKAISYTMFCESRT